MTKANELTGFLAAAAMGLTCIPGRGTGKVCELCQRPIEIAQGYRETKTGYAHGACAMKKDKEAKGGETPR